MAFIGKKFVWLGSNADPEQVTLLEEIMQGQCKIQRFNGKTAICPISELYARTSASKFHAGKKSLMDSRKYLWVDKNQEVWGSKPSSIAAKEGEEAAAAAKEREKAAAVAKEREKAAAAAKEGEKAAAAAKEREGAAAAAKEREKAAAAQQEGSSGAAAAKERKEEAAAAQQEREKAAAAAKERREEAAAAQQEREKAAAAAKEREKAAAAAKERREKAVQQEGSSEKEDRGAAERLQKLKNSLIEFENNIEWGDISWDVKKVKKWRKAINAAKNITNLVYLSMELERALQEESMVAAMKRFLRDYHGISLGELQEAEKLIAANEEEAAGEATGLPDGWTRQQHETCSGRLYATFSGPQGERARSKKEAHRMAAAASPTAASPTAVAKAAAACKPTATRCDDSDPPCALCEEVDDEPHVICDQCEKLYHLACMTMVRMPDSEKWFCSEVCRYKHCHNKAHNNKRRRLLAVSNKKTPKIDKAAVQRTLNCKECDACTREDCGECKNCLDMPKFGGPGIKKKRCEKRTCTNPMPPPAYE